MVLGIITRLRSWVGSQTAITDGGTAAVVDAPDLNVDDDVLLDGVGLPAFVLDEAGRVAAWNSGVEALTGTTAHAALGHRNLGELMYNDPSSKALAQTVLKHPKGADEVDGVELDDPDRLLYAKEETFADARGADCHARHTAMPLYEDGELVGVLQTVRNRTEEVERHREVTSLVDEVETTLRELSRGNLDARATIDESGVVDDQLLLVVDSVNETARNLSHLAANVEDETETATAAVTRAASAADAIVENVEQQRTLLDEGATQMQQFSATMEEVAATADEVDTAAGEAREAAAEGREANTEARSATESVVTMSDELVDRVTELGDRMDDIEAVVEVISEVAEQTNLLALNANIEAARAGEDGDGFAVVAEEVKSLADETRQHTEDITAQIESIQSRTDEAVSAATESNDRIEHADESITEMLEAFEEIASSIDVAADGVAEVSRATDEQAEAVEELTVTIEDVHDRTIETEGAVDSIVVATEESTQALSSLAMEVEELTGGQA
ncbi:MULTISPECIES: methyl-accepting chemotaxis protein [Haloferax]|uniref:PAS domain-containing protein n=2 Tax=Haloferax TaxID=2251 RepID=A0A6G1Z021_9EURY|nr:MULTISPECIES: methyl-accepting chemotaxis protein [Haloferax]KAB1187151.1 PAS domain-containing protein [Haloferax sp. CBA1149]MRW79788.1 PAS domain-containing protein [Haloferax marinisediminis]